MKAEEFYERLLNEQAALRKQVTELTDLVSVLVLAISKGNPLAYENHEQLVELERVW